MIFQYEQANTNNWTLSNNAVRRNSRDLRNVGNVEQLYGIVEDKINHIFDQVDVNNDGFISHGEFLCAMTGLDYYLDSEPFHREPDDDDSEEGSEEEEEDERQTGASAPMTQSQQLKVQLSAQSSHKYREQDLQDLTNNEFEFNEEEEDPVDVELKKASMNAKAANSSKKSPGGVAAAPQSPVKSPPPSGAAVTASTTKSRDTSPVRNNVASPTCKLPFHYLK